ncbi:acid protease [Diplodia corticola]|uniref:Acid protease n=1 Tax=Diplodia corticola TaxID=236234 RepID=A0A1J9S274_9PEZI|nr:acid protease [Diplodia corticola]OJD33749.1 acid protease [Diplodia corticola]
MTPLARPLLVAALLCTAQAESTAKPISLQPTQYWDGNDGPWSTFAFTIGTPAQTLHLLPATGQSALWPILPEGCLNDDRPTDTCQDARGSVFLINESSTWVEEGIYSLSTLWVEQSLGVGQDARGHYGFDTVGLSWPSFGLPSLDNQVVGGIADKTIYEGTFPLSPRPVNFTDLNNPHATVLQTLVNQSMIPSTSWSYTAGSYNRVPKVYGSLTLGGKDTARYEPNDITIPFGSDISRDLLCAVQSVTTNISSTPLLSTPNYWFIDSLVASMWFPEDDCTAFEDAFGITWDEDYSIYLINDTQHEKLVDEKAAITITIGANTTATDTVDIVLPYESMALNASWPVYPNATRYFPLKRAVNDTQYTLGRAFLQNAYVIANYDHSTFSVHQALFPESSSTQNIVPIEDVTPDSGTSLGAGTIAGIAVGCAAVVAILALIFWLAYRRKKQRQEKAAEDAAADAAAAAAAAAAADEEARLTEEEKAQNEMDAGADGHVHGGTGVGNKTELEGEGTRHEMQGSGTAEAELYGVEARKFAEMEAQVTPVFEMPANEDVTLPELETPDEGALSRSRAQTPHAELEAPHESRLAVMRERERQQQQQNLEES